MATQAHSRLGTSGKTIRHSRVAPTRRIVALAFLVSLCLATVATTASATWIEDTGQASALEQLTGKLNEDLVLVSATAAPARVLPIGSVLPSEIAAWQGRKPVPTGIRVAAVRSR